MENILGECMLDILSFLDNNVHEHEVEITNDVLKGNYSEDVVNTAMRSLLQYEYILGNSYSGNNVTMYFASGLTERGRKLLKQYGQ